MGFEPNEEQKQFIESNGANVLVSASAGSGKTSTMINKLVKLLCEERVNISNLLVLTYTEAAASEIKLKLQNELSKVILEADDELKANLKHQLENINNAEIGTLHSVCKKLIVKYFYEVNASPDFIVLGENESKYLLDKALLKVFDEHILGQDDEFFELYNCYNVKRSDLSLKQMIMTLLNYLRNKPNSYEWLKSTIKSTYNLNLNENIVCNELMKYFQKKFQDCKPLLFDLIKQCKDGGFDKYLDFLYNRKNTIESLIDVGNFEQFMLVLNSIDMLKKPNKPRNGSAIELDFDDAVDGFNKDFTETKKQLKLYLVENSIEKVRANFQSSLSNTNKLIEITIEVLNLYSEYKNNKNVLDFNDLEDKMIQLVSIDNIRQKLKDDYKFIFFDEYQDINEKQELIVSMLASKDNYYMIGDVKQSIYAFRQSSPAIFINKFYKFQKDGVKNKLINFNQNYRSERNILEFDNLIFDKLITDNTIGINYKDNSRFVSNKEFDKTRVNIKIIDASDTNDESEDREKKEALIVANTIMNILTQTKTDGDKFTYKDIAIIMRQRGSFLKTLCDTLTSLQIPITTTISNDFFGTFEINLMISILQVISNYNNDIPLCVVLKNLFGFSESELLGIRKSSQKKYFYEAIFDGNLSDGTKEKIAKFLNFIHHANCYLSSHTIKEFLIDVINQFELSEYLLSLPNGQERDNNIWEFVSLSDNNNYEYNLDKFLNYLDFISKEDTMQKVGIVGNSVEISTIHHSKGLEYPAVIICGLGKKFSINKDTNNIIINDKYGFGLKCIDGENREIKETLLRNLCKIKNKQNELNEEIRLLYVAMTRPKEYMYLIGQYDLTNLEKNYTKSIYQSNCYFDMIFKAFASTSLMKFENSSKFTLNETMPYSADIEITKLDDIGLDFDKQNIDMLFANANDKLKDALIFATKSTPSSDTITIKNTVTNILREETDYENLNTSPNKLNVEDRIESIDFLKLGSAYHSIMQSLNFTETKQQIEELIDSLIVKKIIPNNYKNYINLEQIFIAKEILKDLIQNADIIYKEKQFIMQENHNKLVKNSDNNTKVIVQGVIDLIVISKGEATLIDYKTNRNTDEDTLTKEYSLQLQLYQKAFEKAYNIPITHKYLYSFSLNKLIEVL